MIPLDVRVVYDIVTCRTANPRLGTNDAGLQIVVLNTSTEFAVGGANLVFGLVWIARGIMLCRAATSGTLPYATR